MIYQYATEAFVADIDEEPCYGLMLLEYDYDVVYVLEHCDGTFSVNQQGTNGGGWQEGPFATFEEADARADAAAIEHYSVKVEVA